MRKRRPTQVKAQSGLGGGANMIGRGHQYHAAPDGRFLIKVDAEPGVPITLLFNWRP